MRPSRDLRRNYHVVVRSLARVRAAVQPALLSSTSASHRRGALAVASIELLNLWNNHVRSYYLSYPIGAFADNGVRLSTATPLRSIDAALEVAVLRFKPGAQRATYGWNSLDEPRWHDPNVFLTLANHVGASNISSLRSAYSVGTSVLGDLRAFRNYFAHRNQDTRRKLAPVFARLGLPSSVTPSEALRLPAIGRPLPIVVEWIDDLELIADAMCA